MNKYRAGRWWLLFLILFFTSCSMDVTPSASIAEDSSVKQENNRDPVITYVRLEDWFVPVSYWAEGSQLLCGDAGPYSLIADTLLQDAPDAAELAQYSQGDWTIASNGAWDFFPQFVQTTAYSIGEQPESMWSTFFKERLAGLGYDGPVLVTEALTFHQKGKEVSIVTASNIRLDGETMADPKTDTGPENDVPLLYTLSALFVEGAAPAELFCHYVEIPTSKESGEQLGYTYSPLGADWLPILFGLQYGPEGKETLFPVYCNHGGELNIRNFKYTPRYLVCDVDGDGESEFIQYMDGAGSLMASCAVYEIGEIPEQVFFLSLN